MVLIQMRRLILMISLLAVIPQAFAAEPPLRFAPLPMVSQEAMVQEYIGPVRYLEEKTGRAIELVYTKDYKTLIERFRRDEIDLAYIGPLPYLMLSQGFDAATPLVRFLEPDGRDSYTCALVVFGNNPLPAGGMRGKRLALPDPLSTCGDVGIGAILRQADVPLRETQRSYLDRHDAVAMAVILDQADAGGLKTSVARKYASLGLNVLTESPYMPGFVFLANAHTVPAETRSLLREALLILHPQENPVDAERVRDWGGNMRHGTVPSSDTDFDTLRQQWAQTKKDR